MPSVRNRPIAIICQEEAFLLLVGASTIIDAHAASRIGEIEVRGQQGMPCFSITYEEQKSNGVPLIHALRVSERVAGQSPINVWSFYLSQTPLVKLDTGMCMPYGEAPADADTQRAQPLKPWQIYSVGMSGSTGNPADGTQGYLGDFCIVPSSTGFNRIVDIPRESRPETQLSCRDWLPGQSAR